MFFSKKQKILVKNLALGVYSYRWIKKSGCQKAVSVLLSVLLILQIIIGLPFYPLPREVQASTLSPKVYVVISVDTEPKNFDVAQETQALDMSDYEAGGHVADAMDSTWRNSVTDSNGTPVKITWFCRGDKGTLAQGEKNPAYDALTDNFSTEISTYGDELAFHYHNYNWTDPNIDGTFHWNQIEQFTATEQGFIEEALARLLIDDNFFPVSHRAGWRWTNNDSMSWLNDYFLIDASGEQNAVGTDIDGVEPFMGIYDWTGTGDYTRSASAFFHPLSTEYRKKGKMNIFEGIFYGTSDANMDLIFSQAQKHDALYVAGGRHSWDNLDSDIDSIYTKLESRETSYGVNYEFVTMSEALEKILQRRGFSSVDVSQPTLTISDTGGTATITSNDNIVGSQPFVALKTAAGAYSRVDVVSQGSNTWTYNTSGLDAGYTIGAAANRSLSMTYTSGLILHENNTSGIKTIISKGQYELDFSKTTGDTPGTIRQLYDLTADAIMSRNIARGGATEAGFDFCFYGPETTNYLLSNSNNVTLTALEETDTRIKIRATGDWYQNSNYPYTIYYTLYSDGKIFIELNITNNSGITQTVSLLRVVITSEGTRMRLSLTPRADNTNDANGAAMTTNDRWVALTDDPEDFGNIVLHEFDFQKQTEFGAAGPLSTHSRAQFAKGFGTNNFDITDGETLTYHFMYQLLPNNLTDDVDIDTYSTDYTTPDVSGTVTMATGAIKTNSTGDDDTDGWNEREGSYEFNASSINEVKFDLDTGSITKHKPVFRIHNYTASTEPLVKYNNSLRTEGTDYLVSMEGDLGNDVVLIHWLHDVTGSEFEMGIIPAASTIGTPASLSSSSIRWNFTDNANNEIGFKLYDNTDTLATSSAMANLSCLDETGLSENTQYSGRYVVAYNGYGNSASSLAASATYTLVGIPTNLSAVADTNSIALSVDSFPNDTADSSGYYFSRSGANSDWLQTNSWTDTGLSCGTSYAYTVKYRNGDGTETDTISLTQSTNNCGGGGGLPPAAFSPPSLPTPSPENPQGGFRILINDDAEYTDSRTVSLKLLAGSDTKKMVISNIGDFTEAGQEEYQETKEWDLCSKYSGLIKEETCPDGTYTVYAKFYTQYGQPSEVVSDSIILDTKAKEEITPPEPEKEIIKPEIIEEIPPIEESIPPAAKPALEIKPAEPVPAPSVPTPVGPTAAELQPDKPILTSTQGNVIVESITPQKPLKLVAGLKLKTFIKPSKPVKTIKVIIIFKKPKENSQLESNFFSNLLAAPLVYAQTWQVAEYTLTDEDGDGIFEDEIKLPEVAGEYVIRTTLYYEDGTIEDIETEILIDPRGYIYQAVDDQELRIKEAQISLYILNPETSQFELWPAQDYDQENPQTTDKTGQYEFLVPAGKYYLTITASDYQDYQSEEFEVKEGDIINSNIELTPIKKFNWQWLTFLVMFAIGLIVGIFIRLKKKLRVSEGNRV
jgi:hypothetical protein